ncbi:MAG: nicotinamide-nucleotide amidohydrolase family protein [Oscillospiraceae bacterium]|nr:nicotinamide-nucleotide amidohydrolase family protein [Oscillospiraceae bacterium]
MTKDYLQTFEPKVIDDLKILTDILQDRRVKIATAESCTAGLLAGLLTASPGASKYFDMGLICYSNQSKTELLGVPVSALEEHGAVSETVAAMMAEAVRVKSGANIGVSITGIAGPGGGTEDKPVGTVYAAISIPSKMWVSKIELSGQDLTRAGIRRETVAEVVGMLKSLSTGNADDNFADYGEQQEREPVKKGIKGRLVGIVKTIIPWKGDRPAEIVPKCIFIAAIILFVFSIAYISNYVRINYTSGAAHDLHIDDIERTQPPELVAQLPAGYLEKFATLYSQNKDIAGWIDIPGTAIRYPVVKTTNNSFYLDNDFFKRPNPYGVPFMDYRNKVGRQGQLSQNTMLHGHAVRVNTHFNQLTSYDRVSFYKENPIITFDTVYEEMKWVVIGAYLVTVLEKDGPVFRYHDVVDTTSRWHFDWYVNQIKMRSVITTNVDVRHTDKLLTLSTCAYNLGRNTDARYVVVARLLRPNEDPSDKSIGARAIQNPEPWRPDIWYTRNNSVMPERFRNTPAVYPGDPVNPGNDRPPVDLNPDIIQ